MAGGKPLVVSDCPPQQRIVDSAACGLVHEAENADALASCIRKIHDDAVLAEEMGRRGKAAVLSYWNWEVTSKAMIQMYSALSAEFRNH